ncbi:unnamed protein product [Ixodes pacificus]
MYGKNSVWSFCTESSTMPHLRAFRMRENSCFIAGYTTHSRHLFTSCVSCTLRRVHVKVRAALCDTAPISRGKAASCQETVSSGAHFRLLECRRRGLHRSA